MKITIEKKVSEEVEITFPHFTKTSCHNLRFNSANELMIVTGYGNEVSIAHKSAFPDSWMAETPSNEAEFNKACESAFELLKAKF
jgi:hypothetical protein